MGIKYLNKFLRENVSKHAIKCIPIRELSGKKIAIDISIYMFKFLGDNSLVESMYIMLALFRHHQITPIFVFDGKPPAEKKNSSFNAVKTEKKRKTNSNHSSKHSNRIQTWMKATVRKFTRTWISSKNSFLC